MTGPDVGTAGSEPASGVTGATGVAAAEELRTSARGWHGAQLAVLGFIGLCGVLNDGGSSQGPRWMQALAAALVLAALVLQCAAVVLVGGVAWPLGPSPDLAAQRRRLRAGVVVTFVAVAVLALGTTSGWWPQGDGSEGQEAAGGAAVELSTAQGTVCGTLRAGEAGTVTLAVGDRLVRVPAASVSRLAPVASCP